MQRGLQGSVFLLQRIQPAQILRPVLVDQGEHFLQGDCRVQAADPLAHDFFRLCATPPAQWIAATIARQPARRSKKRQFFRRHAQGFAQRCAAYCMLLDQPLQLLTLADMGQANRVAVGVRQRMLQGAVETIEPMQVLAALIEGLVAAILHARQHLAIARLRGAKAGTQWAFKPAFAHFQAQIVRPAGKRRQGVKGQGFGVRPGQRIKVQALIREGQAHLLLRPGAPSGPGAAGCAWRCSGCRARSALRLPALRAPGSSAHR